MHHIPLFPMFLSLSERLCVVVGGGLIACQKVQTLLQCGARIKVIALTLEQDMQKDPWSDRLTWEQRAVVEEDLEGAWLVVAATEDRAVNRQVALWCRVRGIDVNVVDAPAESTFVFPTVLRRDGISLGISTTGASSVLNQQVRDLVDDALPEWLGNVWLLGQRLRPCLWVLDLSVEHRKHLWEALMTEAIARQGQWQDEEARQWLEHRALEYRKIADR